MNPDSPSLNGGITVLREYTAAEEADSVVRMLVLSGRNDYDLKRLSDILKRDYGITLEVTKIAEDKLRLKLLPNKPEIVSPGVNPYREAYLDEKYPGIRRNEYVKTEEEPEKETEDGSES